MSLAVNVLTKSPKISHIIKGDIFQLPFSRSDGNIKVLPCGFQQCLGPFSALIVENRSETRFF